MTRSEDSLKVRKQGDEPLPTVPSGPAAKSDITFHQLRIFWTVAHAETVTKAAKQLGMTQPSLSQQLSKLEGTIGTLLFERRSNQMVLTEAGRYLMRQAEQVLRGMRELEDGLSAFSSGTTATIHIAGIASPLRVLLPLALQRARQSVADLEVDVHESAPADVLELLYARRVNIGMIASNTLAQASVGFLQVPLIDDPYVLVVPAALELDEIADPARELSPSQRRVLNSSIQFVFGTQHAKRIQEWYDGLLPDSRTVAQCRSFEAAVAMVRAGIGVCLAPALSTLSGIRLIDGIRLYRVQAAMPRRIVALVPSQYRRLEPYSTLLDALQEAGSDFAMPTIAETPPFLRRSRPWGI